MSKLGGLRERLGNRSGGNPVGDLLGRLQLSTAIPGLAATAMIVTGILSDSWWTGGGAGVEVAAGLHQAKVCILGTCETGPIRATSFFGISSSLTFFGGFAVALSLLFDTIFRQVFGLTMVPRTAGHACAGFAVAAVLCVIAFPGVGQAGVGIGYGFYVTMVGALLGIYSGYAHIFGGRMKTDGYVPVVIGPDGKPVLDGSGVGSQLQIPHLVDGVRTDDKSLWSWRGGAKRMVRFLDVDQISARELPATAPYHGKTFIDIVPLGQGASPIRVIEGATLDLHSVATAEDDELAPTPSLRALIEEVRAVNSRCRLVGNTKRFAGGGRADPISEEEL